MNDEFEKLKPAQRLAVRLAIGLARQQGGRHATHASDGGEAYAYPEADGIAWGFNGESVARGVCSAKPETVRVIAYCVCSGYGDVVTEHGRSFAEARAALIRMRSEHPAEFYHIEQRLSEIEL